MRIYPVINGRLAGGTSGQVPFKNSNANFDIGWETLTDSDDWTVAPTQTSAFTAADRTVYPIDATTGAIVVTMPHTPSGIRARFVRLDATFAHAVTVEMDSGNLLSGGGSYSTITLNTSGAVMDVIADGTDGIVLSPVMYGGDATIRNLTVGVGSPAVGLLEAADDFQHGGDALGFYGATVATKQTVTGSKGGNAALTSLMAALVTYGLVTDTTT